MAGRLCHVVQPSRPTDYVARLALVRDDQTQKTDGYRGLGARASSQGRRRLVHRLGLQACTQVAGEVGIRRDPHQSLLRTHHIGREKEVAGMSKPEHVLFVSWGNDSIALMQWAHEKGLRGVVCAYGDTGWSDKEWISRVSAGEKAAQAYGFATTRIPSVGMQRLVQIRKGWPSNQYQFCTKELKIKPALAWLDSVDPEKNAVCLIGVRREESKRRASFPEWVEESEGHGGRSLWAPLVRFSTAERDALLSRAGFEPLATRSMECHPCVNANRADLRTLSDDRVVEIEQMEKSLGVTSKGNPRYMFRPGRFCGAKGIREVKRWADSERGQYDPDGGGCDSGWCGS